MVTGLEIIPISTLLTLLTTQVLEIAVAAKDVLVEKESFQKLSRYLFDIEPVLKELKERCFKDLTAASQALSSLKADLDRAHTLVNDCQDKSKFYLLLHCRAIVKDAQDVTRDIGKDLELLSLAGTELALDVRDNLVRLKNQFLSAEYQASETRLEILNKLEAGIREHRTDQGFANDLIVAIATAVGVPVNPSEISKELSSFQKEKEHLAERKARQEEAFMEQVIQLLSKADAAYNSDILRHKYQNWTDILASGGLNEEEPLEPLSSFICPLKRDVMVDPVLCSTNQTYERTEIERWLANGSKVDPLTHVELTDFSLRSNNSLRNTIQEWTERNYCIRIRKAKRLLGTKDASNAESALDDLCKLCAESDVNTEWIAAGHVIAHIVEAVKLRNKVVQGKALATLHALVRNNAKNRDEVVEAGGLEQVVRCLGKSTLSKLAVSLLLELLEGDGSSVCEKLCEDKSAFLYLVMLQNENDATAKLILEKLCDKDQNIVQMASMSYFDPLIESILKGSDESRLVMARAIENIESLSDDTKAMLGDRGVIPPLLQMMVLGNFEAKAAGLGAIKNLSSNFQNQRVIAKEGGFLILMDHLTSPRSPQPCRESAAIALKNLTLGSKEALSTGSVSTISSGELKQVVETLFGLLESSSYGLTIRAHVLQVLLGLSLSDSGEQVQVTIQSHDQGISLLVGLLEGTEKDVRDSAIALLCSLSGKGGAAISECVIKHEKLDFLVNLLSNSSSREIQAALSTIFAGFPSDKETTETLVKAGVLPPLLSLIKVENSKVAEAALSALQRFTEPSSKKLQKELAESNVHASLVTVVGSGTVEAKASAARILRNFSANTGSLTIPVSSSGWLCFRPSQPSICRVHGGMCNVKTTFCIVEAKAVPVLISLLDEPSTVAAEAAIDALETFVCETETRDRAAWFLHEANAIDKALGVLSYGTPAGKERTIDFLTCLFSVKKIREAYGQKVKLPLVELATSGSVEVKRKAARVLQQLSMIQLASSYFGESTGAR